MWTANPCNSEGNDGGQPSPDAQLAHAALVAVSKLTESMQIPSSWDNVYTVMMRNLPNSITQKLLLTNINKEGFLGSYDFVYLPIDPKANANRGYAFINFIEPAWASKFRSHYEGQKFGSATTNKIVSVVPALLQGYEANAAHYSSTRVVNSDPAERPLFLREAGVEPHQTHRQPVSLIDMAAVQLKKQPDNLPQPGRKGKGKGKPQAEGLDRQAKFCSYCGFRFKPEFKFCGNCGASTKIK